ncbi:MAG: hypothetical protein AB1452_04350 [Pseudomonadota bacterium]
MGLKVVTGRSELRELIRVAAAVAISIVCVHAASQVAPGRDGDAVAFRAQGKAIALTTEERSAIAARIGELMVGCGMNSISSPQIFAGRALGKEWQQARAGSHLHVRFEKALRSRRGSLRISEVLIGFDDPGFIGPELTRHGGEIVGHVKCDGHRSLALMCATALQRHLLPGQLRSCAAYDRIGEARKAP